MNATDKQICREQALLHRAQIDKADPSEDPDKAVEHFCNVLEPSADDIVALYWPKDHEFDTLPLLHNLLKSGVSCALPVVVQGTRELSFIKWDETIAMEKGAYGIMQPVMNADTTEVIPTIIGVPLLAFDRKGHRLGYGGGYYDATIQKLRQNNAALRTVGICYAQQAVLFNLPIEEHDQPLDWIVTPQGAQKYSEQLTD